MTIEEQLAVLRRGTSEIISEADLAEKLGQGRPLRVKLGVDPTVAHVTLGWAVVLRKLRDFQRLGHTACLIIGDFTAQIGDPSGKSKTRPQLSREEVQANVEAVSKQVYKILDPDKTEIHFNGDWLNKMDFSDVIRLASKTTVARIMERDDFTKRWNEHRPIALHEILYPLCQGYDSVAIRSDIELGGNDQKFNNLVGRDLQQHFGQEPQVVMLCPLLVGTDGKEKMSQSLGNYISIVDPPQEMYGKTMSIPDDIMENWFELCTDVPLEAARFLCRVAQEGKVNPRDVKHILAMSIVAQYHPDLDQEGKAALEQRKEIPMPREVLESFPKVQQTIPIVKEGKVFPIPVLSVNSTVTALSVPASSYVLEANSAFVSTFSKREQPVEAEEAAIPVELEADGVVALANLIGALGLARSNGAARDLIKAGAVSLDGERIDDPFVKLPREALIGKVLKVGKHQFRRLA